MSSIPYMRLTSPIPQPVPGDVAHLQPPADRPSANPAQAPLAPPSRPRGPAWIDLPTAVERSGVGEGHLRRLCGDRWMADGLAKLERPAKGGKACWFVREDADARFAPVKSPEQLSSQFDVRTLTEAQRKELFRRKKIIDDWTAARTGGIKLGFTEAQITTQFLDRLHTHDDVRLSRRTLFYWLDAYRREGLKGLMDKRGQREKTATQADPFLEEVKRLFLDQRRRKLTVCWEIATEKAEVHGWERHSYKACQRFIDTIPKPVVLKYRFGEEAFVNEAESYIERDYSMIESNDLWGADHHQFDVWVENGHDVNGCPRHVRPWLSAWMDARSRKIVGWCITAADPNTDSILRSFKVAVTSHGVPKSIQVDNGKDFDSFALHGRTKRQRFQKNFDPDRIAGVFNLLGIDARNVQPYHGQSKPIERFFGTVEERFGKTFATYCGSSPDTRPEDLQRKLESGQAPSLEEFAAKFGEWVEVGYHHRPHAGDGMDGMTPAAVFDRCLSTKVTTDAQLLEMYCLEQAEAKVTRNGVRYKGIYYGKDLDELTLKRLGQTVSLRIDPDRVNQVHVFALDGKFIGLAASNVRLSPLAGKPDLAEAMGAKKRARKTLKEYVDTSPRMAEDLTTAVNAAARRRAAEAAKANPGDPSPTHSMKPLQTGFEDHFAAARAAVERQQLRSAVGAEALTDQDSGTEKLSALAERLRRSRDDE